MTETTLIAEETNDPVPEATHEGEAFDAPVRTSVRGVGLGEAANDADIEALVVDIDGYEGPLDVLLDLARAQKVDLRKISILALVEQYMAFIEAAKAKSLELAADYLVMAAWLAYLKSKLLLPSIDDNGEEPTADEMAARLAFRLQRLEAMRKSADAIMALPQFGVEVFPRGAPEGVRVLKSPDWQADLFELLQAYARQRVATVDRTYKFDPPKVFSIEEARQRLERILGSIPDWVELRSLTKSDDIDAPESSVVASAFNAALEFAKNGQIDLRQLGHFEPIYVRQRRAEPDENDSAKIADLKRE